MTVGQIFKRLKANTIRISNISGNYVKTGPCIPSKVCHLEIVLTSFFPQRLDTLGSAAVVKVSGPAGANFRWIASFQQGSIRFSIGFLIGFRQGC